MPNDTPTSARPRTEALASLQELKERLGLLEQRVVSVLTEPATFSTRHHPADRCAWCGADDRTADLIPTVHKDTRQPAMRCRDDVQCLRRMSDAREAA
jgi:hypothetical protein